MCYFAQCMIKKQNRTSKKEGKKLSLARSNPGPWACEVNAWSIAPRRLMLNIVLIFFACEILPIDAVWSW